MPALEKTGLSGLVTNVAETQAPPGTLVEAENVVMRRPGCIEPRDGLQLAGTLGSGFAAWGFSWRTKDFILRNVSNVFDLRDTAGSTYRYTDPESQVVGDPQLFRRDVFSRAEARANLYLPNSAGVCKLETDSGPLKTVGIPHAFSLTDFGAPSAAYGAWLANNEQVSYRIVLTRKDANRVLIVSLPSGFLVQSNTSGGAAGTKIRITVSNYIEWDACEVYRTRNFPTSVQTDDEMQIVATLEKAVFGSFAFSYIYDFVDGIDPTLRGKALYTSPSQGGMDEQNFRPPAAALTALFRGSVFFANVRSPKRLKVSATFRGSITTATGLGVRVYTANRTSGSNQLTSLSSTVGLEKGMVVNVDTILRYITNISGTTVTLSGNASTTLVGASYTFYDSVNIDGNWFQVGAFGTPFPQLVVNNEIGVLVQSITPAESGYNTTFEFEALLRDTSNHTIQATHGSEYYPQLPNYDGTPLQLTQDAWPGGYMFAKTDEPEHVRPIDYGFVGDQNRAVLALIPTRDALFFVKEDGIFRLTGANGVWRVDPFDPTARCVLPSSARSLRGRGIFLGDRGVALISDEEGVQLVSAPVNDQVKPLIDQIVAGWLSTGFYELPSMAGASAACVFERESEYTLARGNTTAPLVYNDVTGAWTTLAYYGHANESLSYKALFNFERSGNCVLSLGLSYFKTILSTDAGADYLRYDRATAVTVSSYVAPNATLSAPVNALEDDVIKDSAGRYWRVTADVNNSATVPVVLGGGTAAMAPGAGTLYRSLRCSVTATGFAIPLSSQKHWGAFNTAWTKLVGVVRLRYGYQSSESPAFVEESAYTSLAQAAVSGGTGVTNYTLGLAPPARVPTASARAWLLRARIRWAMAHGDAQLEGISADLIAALQPGAKQQVAA